MADPGSMEHGEVGRNGRLLALALAAALVATGLGLVGTPNAFDRRIAAVPFGGLAPGFLAGVAALTGLGAPLGSMILTALACALLLLRRRRIEAGLLFVATSSAAVLFPLLKRLFSLPRPADPLVAASGHGFPSGHSLVSTVMWGYLAWILLTRLPPRRWRNAGALLCLALPAAIGLSRIVLRVHWLTDVVGGWLYGLACLAAALWLDRHYRASPARSRSR